MAESTKNVYEYARDGWTLADLREIVTDTTSWDATSVVTLYTPQTPSTKGTIEVAQDL